MLQDKHRESTKLHEEGPSNQSGLKFKGVNIGLVANWIDSKGVKKTANYNLNKFGYEVAKTKSHKQKKWNWA